MTSFIAYTPDTAEPETSTILKSIQDNYGFIPNLFAYMAESPAVLNAYLTLNDLVSQTTLKPDQIQLACLATSVENQCEFCTVAHRALGKASGVASQTLEAVYTHQPIDDPQDHAWVNFVTAVVHHRGHAPQSAQNAFLEAGFTQKHMLELVLVVTLKTLSNYTNHLTHPQPNPELLAML